MGKTTAGCCHASVQWAELATASELQVLCPRQCLGSLALGLLWAKDYCCMLSYERVVGCYCELAKQCPSCCCTAVNLNACSSPQTSQGTARKAWSQQFVFDQGGTCCHSKAHTFTSSTGPSQELQ